MAASQWEAGQTIIEDYRVERVLGEGGMGTVHLVRRMSDESLFAVKTQLTDALDDPDKKRMFMRELRTWIDMPDHPHITSCRFFKSIDDRIAIFSEFVDGGSLQNWIQMGKLDSIETILDVLIQFAWGIEAAHEMGVVHQDIKPGNALMTRDGVLKITDFGLARAQLIHRGDSAPRVPSKDAAGPAGQSVLVSRNGMTLAYCSPEQAMGQRVGRRTDMWSWGVSVLEIFHGRVVWSTGFAASAILTRYLNAIESASEPVMPLALVPVLERCFCSNPLERWTNMGELAQELVDIYEELTGEVYPRLKPPLSASEGTEILDRRVVGGQQWLDPRECLNEVLREIGEPAIKKGIATGSLKSQALADLEIFDEAQHLFENLIVNQPGRFESAFATMLTNKALVFFFLLDEVGFNQSMDRSLAVRERILADRRDPEELRLYFKAMAIRGNFLVEIGLPRMALDLSDRIAAGFRELIQMRGTRSDSFDYSCYLTSKAQALFRLNLLEESRKVYEESIAMQRALCESNDPDLYQALSVNLMNLASVMGSLRDLNSAIALLDEGIALSPAVRDGRRDRETLTVLALSYINRGVAYNRSGNAIQADQSFREGMAILEQLVLERRYMQLADPLTVAYINYANLMDRCDQIPEASDYYDRAVRLIEPVVHLHGNRRSTPLLAHAIFAKASFRFFHGEQRTGIELIDQAVSIMENRIRKEGRTDEIGVLARFRSLRGRMRAIQGDRNDARTDLEYAIPILDAEFKRTGNPLMRQDREGSQRTLSEIEEGRPISGMA